MARSYWAAAARRQQRGPFDQDWATFPHLKLKSDLLLNGFGSFNTAVLHLFLQQKTINRIFSVRQNACLINFHLILPPITEHFLWELL